MSVLDHLVQTVATLTARVNHLPVYVWGTVDSTAPIVVARLDTGEQVQANAVLEPGLQSGDRVLCMLHNNRLMILGKNHS